MLKLGILGMSEGNGHPYSWSAICNGYNSKYMKESPFPGIYAYLEDKKFPEDMIVDASVTHIWTQDLNISTHISKATNIKNIVSQPEEMIGEVDAILLARDDYENHLNFSRPFIKAGLPIYIDKPIATDTKTALNILDTEVRKGQIFSCSAMKYSNDFEVSLERLQSLGEIKYIYATVMKSWDKYSIHVLDPILKIIGYNQEIVSSKVIESKGVKNVVYLTSQNIIINVTVVADAIHLPFKITIVGSKSSIDLEMKDTYDTFKSALQKFINITREIDEPIAHKEMLKAVEFIEVGM